MRFAHSLGYPHHDLMLRDLSGTEYRELLAFFRVEREERQEGEERAREANLRQWFDRRHAIQRERRNGR